MGNSYVYYFAALGVRVTIKENLMEDFARQLARDLNSGIVGTKYFVGRS